MLANVVNATSDKLSLIDLNRMTKSVPCRLGTTAESMGSSRVNGAFSGAVASKMSKNNSRIGELVANSMCYIVGSNYLELMANCKLTAVHNNSE